MILQRHFGFREGRLEFIHTINGKHSPLGTEYMVHLGQVVRFQIENKTDEFHTMHLHGHHFAVLARNGQPLRGSPVRLDSLLVGPQERWDIAFVADSSRCRGVAQRIQQTPGLLTRLVARAGPFVQAGEVGAQREELLGQGLTGFHSLLLRRGGLPRRVAQAADPSR